MVTCHPFHVFSCDLSSFFKSTQSHMTRVIESFFSEEEMSNERFDEILEEFKVKPFSLAYQEMTGTLAPAEVGSNKTVARMSIPCSGNFKMLEFAPFGHSKFEGRLREGAIHFNVSLATIKDEANFGEAFAVKLKQLKEITERLAGNIDQFNKTLEEQGRALFISRRVTLDRQRRLVSGLGIVLKQS